MVWVVGVQIVASVSLMLMMRIPMKVHIQEEGDLKVGRVCRGALQLPKCRREQEWGNTGGKGASRREGEADWIPSLLGE